MSELLTDGLLWPGPQYQPVPSWLEHGLRLDLQTLRNMVCQDKLKRTVRVTLDGIGVVRIVCEAIGGTEGVFAGVAKLDGEAVLVRMDELRTNVDQPEDRPMIVVGGMIGPLADCGWPVDRPAQVAKIDIEIEKPAAT